MRLTPIQMAELYWTKLRRKAIEEIDAILSSCRADSPTRRYWVEVKSHLVTRR